MKISNADNLKIVKTDLKQIKTINFDCGDEDLNEFLLKDSFENIKNNLCTIFLCIYEEDVIGFFSLSADSIKINDELKIQYPQYPAIKIGILAVLREQKEMKLKGNLYHNTQIVMTYNTNHIEGSTLSEEQTRYIFETNTLLTEKDTITDIDDIIETQNHFKLFDYMLEVADKKLTEKMIKDFHKIAKKYDFLEIRRTGTYRQLLQAQREAPAPAQGDYKKLYVTISHIQ